VDSEKKNEKEKGHGEDLVSVEAKVKISEIGFGIDAILVRGPIRFLMDELDQNRLLEGVIVSVMYFEYLGGERLKQYFSSKDVPLEPLRIDQLSVSKVMHLLRGFGVISNGAHSKICQVVSERNKIVHELQHPDSLDENRARSVINKAIECLKEMGVN
jgi:hypothetical protein